MLALTAALGAVGRLAWLLHRAQGPLGLAFDPVPPVEGELARQRARQGQGEKGAASEEGDQGAGGRREGGASAKGGAKGDGKPHVTKDRSSKGKGKGKAKAGADAKVGAQSAWPLKGPTTAAVACPLRPRHLAVQTWAVLPLSP